MATLENTGANSTIDQIKDAGEEVRRQAEEARRAVREYNESKANELRDAVDDLRDAVKDISKDDTVAEARASIQDELVAARAAREKLASDLSCR
jgi:hypothetical protein